MFFLIALIALIGLLLPVAGYAAVNDISPGDYYPLQPGQTAVADYAFDREFRGPYVAIDNGFRNTREVTLRLQKVFWP